MVQKKKEQDSCVFFMTPDRRFIVVHIVVLIKHNRGSTEKQ